MQTNTVTISPNEPDYYGRLTEQYAEMPGLIHRIAFVVLTALVVIELFGVWLFPEQIRTWLGKHSSTVPGYQYYTPIVWLAAAFTGLANSAAAIYAKDQTLAGRARHRIVDAGLSPDSQKFLLLITICVVALEIVLIVSHSTTISAWTRGLANRSLIVYWIGGILAGAIASELINAEHLRKTTKLILVAWMAVFAHIFWWITP